MTLTNFHNVGLSFHGSQIQVLYDGAVSITATDGTYPNGLVALDVSNQVVSFGSVLVTSANPNTGSITPAPSSLSFSASYQGPNPSSQALQVNGGGGGSLVWTAATSAPWLNVSPLYGTTPGNLQVSVASSTLAPGNYSGTITVYFTGSSQCQCVHYSYPHSGRAAAIVGRFTIHVKLHGPKGRNCVGAVDCNYQRWLRKLWMDSIQRFAHGWPISPASGSTPQSMIISVLITSGLATGSYTGHATVTASGVAKFPANRACHVGSAFSGYDGNLQRPRGRAGLSRLWDWGTVGAAS